MKTAIDKVVASAFALPHGTVLHASKHIRALKTLKDEKEPLLRTALEELRKLPNGPEKDIASGKLDQLERDIRTEIRNIAADAAKQNPTLSPTEHSVDRNGHLRARPEKWSERNRREEQAVRSANEKAAKKVQDEEQVRQAQIQHERLRWQLGNFPWYVVTRKTEQIDPLVFGKTTYSYAFVIAQGSDAAFKTIVTPPSGSGFFPPKVTGFEFRGFDNQQSAAAYVQAQVVRAKKSGYSVSAY